MEDHLDMHFRQNRKANQNMGRGHSRSWFVTLEVRNISRPCLLLSLTIVSGLDTEYRIRR